MIPAWLASDALSWFREELIMKTADFEVEIEAPPAYRIAAGATADTISHSPTNNLYRFSLKNANSFAWIADNHIMLKTDSIETATAGRYRHPIFF